MKKKIFAVSDIHGHASLLEQALDKVGFDRNDPHHLLVVCGDFFDRGTENLKVYEYLIGIQNKVLIRGNHEDLMIKVLKRGRLAYHDFHNGTDITVSEFFGSDSIDSYGRLTKKRTAERKLKDLIGQTVDYFETENFIFTHGWIPVRKNDRTFKWRLAPLSEWESARFYEWHKYYPAGLTLPDQVIVCGHRTASLGYMFDTSRSLVNYDTFFGRGVIAIDGCTVQSGQINIVVIEDSLLYERRYNIVLADEQFELLKKGRKTVDIRVCDEKMQILRRGDTVVFSRLSDPEDKVKATVTGCYLYDSIMELLNDFKPRELGFSGMTKQKILRTVTEHYGKESLTEHGILAVKVKVIS